MLPLLTMLYVLCRQHLRRWFYPELRRWDCSTAVTSDGAELKTQSIRSSLRREQCHVQGTSACPTEVCVIKRLSFAVDRRDTRDAFVLLPIKRRRLLPRRKALHSRLSTSCSRRCHFTLHDGMSSSRFQTTRWQKARQNFEQLSLSFTRSLSSMFPYISTRIGV